MSEVIAGNLRVAVYASHERLAAQVQADNAFDTKLLGLLGLFSAGVSLLLTLPNGLRHERMLLLVGLALGMLACLVGSVGGTNAKVGPPPERFYDDYGGMRETAYLEVLLADLASTAKRNDEGIALRRQALAAAVSVPVLFAMIYGLVSLL